MTNNDERFSNAGQDAGMPSPALAGTSLAGAAERPLVWPLMVFPLLWGLVFLMHFRHPADFFHFHLHYTPRDPDQVVRALVRAGNRWPLLADPHMIGYLGMPVMPLAAYALYTRARPWRRRLGAAALFCTVTGVIYMGGVLAMWTAFYRGLGNVDPAQTEGAIATFRGMTQNSGAFLLTTTLAKLTMVGFALQAAVLWGLAGVPRWAVCCIVAGACLFLAFWDLDNWMLVGSMLMLAGFLGLVRVNLRR